MKKYIFNFAILIIFATMLELEIQIEKKYLEINLDNEDIENPSSMIYFNLKVRLNFICFEELKFIFCTIGLL